ncbi:MAG: ATP-binding protein [Thermofilum sp.]
MALFDLRPKTSRRDLFGRDRELERLHRAVERGLPLVAVLGVRRVGKTSLLKTFLGEVDGIYVDMRGVVRRVDLEVRVSDALSESLGRLRRFLEGVRGVSVAGFSVEVRWRGRDSVSLAGLLEELNRRVERFVFVLDEVQAARPPVSAELRSLLAYAYDNLDRVTFIVAGSEVGMLRSFLRLEDPSSPLYGRSMLELPVERFSPEESREFLLRGFREEGVEAPPEAIEEAVSFFDGIVGWLVLYGRMYADGERSFEKLKRAAVELALEELSRLSEREKLVVKAVAHGCRSWAQVRSFIAEEAGVVLPKATLSRIVEKLEKLSILKDYEFLDAVYREASKRLSPAAKP